MSPLPESERSIIDQWIAKSLDKPIVLVIGAGFSKNALIRDTNDSASNQVPLWRDVIEILSDRLGFSRMDHFDDLFIVDLFRDFFGNEVYERVFCESLPDSDIVPGPVHSELARIPLISGVITTNNLDTLLDRTFPRAHRIVKEVDIAGSLDSALDIIYVHGHRSRPETWILSRSDYKDIEANFPVKISIVRNLLARYPSLFIGFGHTDPNLHSIARYLNAAVGSYRPAMLSLSINRPNSALQSHWSKLGLSIAAVSDSVASVEESLLDAIRYISKQRTDTLAKMKKIIPGHRVGESIMESLASIPLDCRCRDGKDYLCDYHSSRAGAVLYRLADQSTIVPTSPFTAIIPEDSDIFHLIRKMAEGFVPTGSWGLMPSHRRWLQQHFAQLAGSREKTLTVLIAGVAGLYHFIDTVSLLLEALEGSTDRGIQVTVIDKCCGPINEIRRYVAQSLDVVEAVEHNVHEPHRRIVSSMERGDLVIHADVADVLSSSASVAYSADVILAHHLVSMWGFEDLFKTKKYAKFVGDVLSPGGALVSAMNVPLDQHAILKCHDVFQGGGLVPLDTELTFDIYDVDLKNVDLEKGIFSVRNETLLTVHKKLEN